MTSMKFSIALLCSAVLTLFSAAACDKSSPDEAQSAGAEEQHHGGGHAEGEHHAEGEGHEMGHDEGEGHELGHEEAEAEEMGTRHDPPITVAEVETGHWMCVMGDVHYTSEEEGDGRCPICGMRLKQKTSDAGEGTDDEAPQ